MMYNQIKHLNILTAHRSKGMRCTMIMQKKGFGVIYEEDFVCGIRGCNIY